MNFPVSIFASNKQKLILPNGFPFPTLDKNINSIADSQGGVPTNISRVQIHSKMEKDTKKVTLMNNFPVPNIVFILFDH